MPLPDELERTRLICAIVSLVRDEEVPDDARAAALTLVGYLARRMPGEGPSRDGVETMQSRAKALDLAALASCCDELSRHHEPEARRGSSPPRARRSG